MRSTSWGPEGMTSAALSYIRVFIMHAVIIADQVMSCFAFQIPVPITYMKQ